MKKNNFKNTSQKVIIFISILLISINNTYAQTDNGLKFSLNFKETANNITNNILTSAVTLLMTAAFVLFFYGVVRFIYDRSTGDDSKLAKDKEAMLWGLGALFIMVSTWGIIRLAQTYLGIQNDNNIQIQAVSFTPPPSITTTGDTNTKTTTQNPANTNPFNQPTNKPEGANCVGQPGSTTQCASGLYCRNSSGTPVAQGEAGTCKTSFSQALSTYPTISAPSQDPYIKNLFLYLQAANCIPSNMESFGTTYDQSDKQFVINFQKANNLTQDGIVGPETWTALFNIVSGAAKKCQ